MLEGGWVFILSRNGCSSSPEYAITTRSDYSIKELNTLILLNKQGDERLSALAAREGYDQGELLATLIRPSFYTLHRE